MINNRLRPGDQMTARWTKQKSAEEKVISMALYRLLVLQAAYDSMLDQLHFAAGRIVDGKRHMLPGLKGFKTVDICLEVAIGPGRVGPFSNDANHSEQQDGASGTPHYSGSSAAGSPCC
jgi:hypothetical protein